MTRNRYVLKLVRAGALAGAMLAPSFALGQNDASFEDRLKRIESVLDSGTLIELLQRVEGLQAELQALRGEIEEQTHSISQLKKRQRELYLDMDRRLEKIETSGVQPASETTQGGGDETTTGAANETVASTDTTDAEPPENGIDPIVEQDAYQNAFNLLKTGRYEDAGSAFAKFLETYSAGRYADNAQYWLGETFYVRQQFEQAIAQFQVLTAKYPDSAKYPHALLKIGYSQAELGQEADARKTFDELIAKYPQSPAARNAQQRLEVM